MKSKTNKISMLVVAVLLVCSMFVLVACGGSPNDGPDDNDKTSLRDSFLVEANKVIVNEDSVTFKDASEAESITIKKNPTKVANLYASFTTLWYEAGGVADGIIGGSSSEALYTEQIGRNITEDDGVEVLATSSAGSRWNTETIINSQPDLIICSTAMSGYSTIKSPAESANIPIIAVDYDDFADYLKWFKVFSNLTGNADLWDSVAMKTLNNVVSVIEKAPTTGNPSVFSMFIGARSLQANTSSTVVGGMITELNANNIVDAWDNTANVDRLEINLEIIFSVQPSIILAQCHTDVELCKGLVEDKYGDDVVWNALDAVKNDKLIYLEKALFHNKPNRKFDIAYQTLAKVLYPSVDFEISE